MAGLLCDPFFCPQCAQHPPKFFPILGRRRGCLVSGLALGSQPPHWPRSSGCSLVTQGKQVLLHPQPPLGSAPLAHSVGLFRLTWPGTGLTSAIASQAPCVLGAMGVIWAGLWGSQEVFLLLQVYFSVSECLAFCFNFNFVLFSLEVYCKILFSSPFKENSLGPLLFQSKETGRVRH